LNNFELEQPGHKLAWCKKIQLKLNIHCNNKLKFNGEASKNGLEILKEYFANDFANDFKENLSETLK
jgi:hypothetical protein